MSYRLQYDYQFKSNLANLPGDVRSVTRKIIAQLANEPRPSRAKELDNHPSYYRLWLPRHYRLVWQVIDDEQIIDLLYVGPKLSDLYSRLGLGRQSD